MAPPKRPWFRMYVEIFADKKLRRQKPATRWLCAAMFGAARQSPLAGYLMISEAVPMTVEDIADYAALSKGEVRSGLEALTAVGIAAFDENLGAWWVPNFLGRQYESDSSADRTSKWRRKGVTSDVTVTPPETEAESETERGGISPEVQQELDARLRRRRSKGEDIGPGLVRLILADVERDLAIVDEPLRWAHAEGCERCCGVTYVFDETLEGVVPCPLCRPSEVAA